MYVDSSSRYIYHPIVFLNICLETIIPVHHADNKTQTVSEYDQETVKITDCSPTHGTVREEECLKVI